MSKKYKVIRVRILSFLLVFALFMLFPYAVTMFATGVIPENISDELINGRSVTVKYKNAQKAMDVNKFIIMVLAGRLHMSSEVEVLKAESVMIRTDIYRIMGDNMNVDSTSLGMTFMNERQMRNDWGDNYESNYNLIADCVASTSNQVITCNGNLIEARYTQVSAGSTLSGAEILGDTYSYLAKVDCPEDIKSNDYLSVVLIPYKEFVKKFKNGYKDVGLDEENPYKDIQIVSKTEDGYITKMQVGNVIMTGSKFSEIAEVNSPYITVENLDSNIKITTKGKGDGFGVSINTADIMAKSGATYDSILKNFYSGIAIESK